MIFRFLNSLRFQLAAAFLILLAILASSVYLNLKVVKDLENSQQILNITGVQRSNIYLLSSLARRLLSAESESEQALLTLSIQNTIENVEQLQLDLAAISEELGIAELERDLSVSLTSDYNDTWISYLDTINQFLSSTNEERPELLRRIDDESVALYTIASRVVDTFDVLLIQKREEIQNLTLWSAGLTIVVVIAALGIVARIILGINSLSSSAQDFAMGNFEARAGTKSLTELAGLGIVFNDMASRLSNIIGGLVKQLERRAVEAEDARAEAERANSVKSQFLAAMSHELRTPLNGIINFTGFVADGMLGEINERQQQFLKDAIVNAEHLLALINDVLDISKIDAGSLKLFVESNISLEAEIQTIARTGETLLKDKPVSLKLEIANNLPPIRGDKRRIRQIILNLVSNACKFTDEGSVTIAASQSNGSVLVTVKDTGPGIAPEDHDKIFETFLQTEAGLRKGGGTGLGLPISRRLAEAHGGRLWVDSALGEGASFYVSLPINIS